MGGGVGPKIRDALIGLYRGSIGLYMDFIGFPTGKKRLGNLVT